MLGAQLDHYAYTYWVHHCTPSSVWEYVIAEHHMPYRYPRTCRPVGSRQQSEPYIRYTRVLTRSRRVLSAGKYDIGARPGPGKGRSLALLDAGDGTSPFWCMNK